MTTWTPMPGTSSSGPAAEPAHPQDRDAARASSSTDPTDVGTTDIGTRAGGSLRASDTDRDQVAALLDLAYAEGRLTHEEHGERVAQVLVARTFDDLVPLTADLVPLGPTPATTTSTVSTVSTVSTSFVVGTGSHTEVDRMVAVFGGVERKGRWRVRARSQVTAIFGGVDLDLREADFDAPVVELTVQACFGGVDILVPAGITVRSETVNIFGGTEVKNLGEPVEGAPTLVIKGTVLFGGVDVKGPRVRRWGRGGGRDGAEALEAGPHRRHGRR